MNNNQLDITETFSDIVVKKGEHDFSKSDIKNMGFLLSNAVFLNNDLEETTKEDNKESLYNMMIDRLQRIKLANLYQIDKLEKDNCLIYAKINRINLLIDSGKRFYVMSPNHEVCQKFSTREQAQEYIDNPIFDEHFGCYIVDDEEI